MNRTLRPGNNFTTQLRIDRELVDKFVELSGDTNPVHVEPAIARAYGHARPVAHGVLLLAAISRLIGTEVPGAGAIWMEQQIEWLRPVFIGDEVSIEVTVEQVSYGTGVLTLKTMATNQQGVRVMDGRARVKMGELMMQPKNAPDSATRVALVTGGSRGIGAAVATRLAADGFIVAVNYRSDVGAANDVVERIRAGGGVGIALPGDMSRADEVSALTDRVIDEHGSLDVIVHSASPTLDTVPVLELQKSHVERYLDVFLGGALALLGRAAPRMVERGFGRLVFLGTSAMHDAPPTGWAGYLTGKYALWGLVRSVAQELGHAGITANMVSPGLTVTDLTSHISTRSKEVEARRNPMRRLATPEDTAAVIAFLVSNAAGYINGTEIRVTGTPS